MKEYSKWEKEIRSWNTWEWLKPQLHLARPSFKLTWKKFTGKKERNEKWWKEKTVVLLQLNRALIKDDGIDMHAATKRRQMQAFKIMFRWYFSRKSECVNTFCWLFCNNILFLSGRLKQVFSCLRLTASSYFDPCNGLLSGPGSLRLCKYVSVKCLCKVLRLFNWLRITSATLYYILIST